MTAFTRRPIAALSAMLLLAAIPRSATANSGTVTARIKINPPVGSQDVTSGKAKINCGYHASCTGLYPPGTGLDWDDDDQTGDEGTCCFADDPSGPNSRGVYTRLWTRYDNGSQYPELWLGTIDFWDRTAVRPCKTVDAEYWLNSEVTRQHTYAFQTLQEKVFYEHATRLLPDGAQGDFWGIPTEVGRRGGWKKVAIMLADTDPEKVGCSTSGEHVHEAHDFVFTKNSSIPGVECREDNGCTRTYPNPWKTKIHYTRYHNWTMKVTDCTTDPTETLCGSLPGGAASLTEPLGGDEIDPGPDT